MSIVGNKHLFVKIKPGNNPLKWCPLFFVLTYFLFITISLQPISFIRLFLTICHNNIVDYFNYKIDIKTQDTPVWEKDTDLLKWLQELCR